ncbi:OmpA family protein [Nostocoides jenkinsii]|uniref:OmpA family protein n=1 Tax=Nostocoides jenkinsii TaxID=330834 RepID=UPI00138DEFE2|nr:OmpA family protein [Tetrasphaera jenkinsii]
MTGLVAIQTASAATPFVSSPLSAADPVPIPGITLTTPLTVTPDVFADPDIHGEVQDLVFREANLDGSLITTGGRRFELAADVLFAFDSADLSPKAEAVLADVAKRLAAVDASSLRIDGYTDSTGDAAYNRGLSQRRADAVRRGLLATSDALTIVARGHGEADPVADNATDSGRQQNRRVTITVADQ